MSIRNPLGPFCGGSESSGRPFLAGDGEQQIIDRLIGNAYEVVKYVACHMADIILVADFLRASQRPPVAPSPDTFINVVPFGNPAVFDLAKGFMQQITLEGDITSSALINIDASYSIIAIRVIQDSVGGRTFAWPAAINSHGDISLDPNAISQQLFSKNTDNTFDYVGPMMYPAS